jgi:late competence protein required for DNA uptake (superfamily II DNA/RNA helicase)
MPEEHESKFVKVYGDKHAREYAERHHAPPAYERMIHARSVTFTCIRCHQEVTEVRFPGPTTYCSECSVIVRREKNAARVRRARAKKKRQEHASPADV